MTDPAIAKGWAQPPRKPMREEISAHEAALERVLWALNIVLICGVFVLNRPWLTPDSPKYLELSQRLGQGFYGTLINGTLTPQTVRPPGYPLVLALLTGCGRLPLMVAVAFNGLFYLGGLLLTARLLRSHRAPVWLFLLLLLFYPLSAAYSSFIMSEALGLLLVCAIAFWLGRPELPSAGEVAAAALCCGFGCLVRADMLLLIPILALALAWRGSAESFVAAPAPRNSKRQVRWKRGALFVVLAVLPLLPYVAWNVRHFGKFSPAPVAGALWNSLYTVGWSAALLDSASASERASYVREMLRVNALIGAPARTLPNDPSNYGDPATQLRSAPVLRQAALSRITDHPDAYARHVLLNAWLLWNTSLFPPSVPNWAQAALRLCSGLLCVLGLGGALWCFVSSHVERALKIPALILLYVPGVHIWLHTEARYTAGVRPLLLFFATLAVSALWQQLGQRRLSL